jgi:hypothetical protein
MACLEAERTASIRRNLPESTRQQPEEARKPYQSRIYSASGPGTIKFRARSLHIRHQTVFSRRLSGEYLEGVFQADKVKLHKVIRSPVHNIIAGLAEYPDVGGKSVFESPADEAKHAIGSDIVA